ncbi:MAG: hypothetical protein PHE33_09765, partial [Bacteroidales bacterium]|nr:hypothetical protein [Bacteroidales bacterium]
MKKYLRLFLIIITTLSFWACNNSSSDKVENTTKETNDEMQDTIVNKIDVEDVVFNEDYIMNIENVYNGEVVNDLIVTHYKYDPDVEFSFLLNGEFVAKGEIMIDEMWDELAIQFDKD